MEVKGKKNKKGRFYSKKTITSLKNHQEKYGM